MNLHDKFLRMSDLANQPERLARSYTTRSGQQRNVLARPASSGITGFSSKHLYHLIKLGKFPQPVKLGRSSRWRVSDINKWLDSYADNINYQNDMKNSVVRTVGGA